MLPEYFSILVFLAVGVVLGVAPLILSRLVAPYRPDPIKQAPYECGFPAFENARVPFDVRYYLVAILFIIFDLETAFLFPWAVVMKGLPWFGIASMGLFLLMLLVGFVYEWQKGALEWE